MIGVIKEVRALDNYILEVVFTYGHIRHYDCRKLIDAFPVFQAMVRNPEIFLYPQVDCGGYGVTWNDNLDVAAEEIWDNGELIR